MSATALRLLGIDPAQAAGAVRALADLGANLEQIAANTAYVAHRLDAIDASVAVSARLDADLAAQFTRLLAALVPMAQRLENIEARLAVIERRLRDE
jgi:hypothetical protein